MTLWIDTWLGDLRIALRALRRQPGFSLAAIGTFALGIGAATAIFSVAYGIAFRPLPFPSAEQLVRIYEANTATGEAKLLVSEGAFQAWREAITTSDSFALFGPARVRYTRADSPQPIVVMAVSPALFDVLGIRPLHGRPFKPESEYGRGKTDELMISYDAWQRFFGADMNVVGRPVEWLEGEDPFVIAGVMDSGSKKESMRGVRSPLNFPSTPGGERPGNTASSRGCSRVGRSIACAPSSESCPRGLPKNSRPPTPDGSQRWNRCETRSSADSGRPAGCCWPRSPLSCSSRARTSRA
jgi:putative ABC transport system permease protein